MAVLFVLVTGRFLHPLRKNHLEQQLESTRGSLVSKASVKELWELSYYGSID
jgi:hypothetical protein